MKFTTVAALFEKTGGKRNGLPAWSYNKAEQTELEMERVNQQLLKQRKLTHVA